ncbi:hypothetical protein CFY87_08115 [Actinobacillus seminis]|uniref:DNA topoisomerase type IA Zn finger domain-containing protein n=1 Tax=Actinobacillus seminis TaxID=722 RepID=A0A263HCL5_9PAST|nr:type I DNA topoisomerase [Actinobacillus seminis]OZN24669.1 hypothetical protein CFY87_08115 [Actinobacillus seminis]SUU38331.1 DNA topoisomerase type IA Zn finger domain-containing protein [Actinobacillus seminis]
MSNSLFQSTKHQEHCPQCGALLQIKQGKKGLFLGCSAYPACDYLKPLQAQFTPKIIKNLDESCPKCGHFLQLKQGHFGMFIGCSHYPECDFVVHEQVPENEDNPLICPDCQQGNLVARRGRQGKIFYACDRFPKCKFTLAGKPYPVRCPQCHGDVAILKKETETHRTWLCTNKICRCVFEVEK